MPKGAESGAKERSPMCRFETAMHSSRRMHAAARYDAAASAPSFSTVFQLRAVPRVPRCRSINAIVSFERP
jgi:hypothetical protein